MSLEIWYATNIFNWVCCVDFFGVFLEIGLKFYNNVNLETWYQWEKYSISNLSRSFGTKDISRYNIYKEYIVCNMGIWTTKFLELLCLEFSTTFENRSQIRSRRHFSGLVPKGKIFFIEFHYEFSNNTNRFLQQITLKCWDEICIIKNNILSNIHLLFPSTFGNWFQILWKLYLRELVPKEKIFNTKFQHESPSKSYRYLW